MYFKLGKLDEAERSFRDAIEAFPGQHQAHAGLGAVLAARGNAAEAIASYRRAQAIVPLPQYTGALADLYTVQGKLEDARKIAVEALTTAPNSPVTTQLRDLLGDINTEIFFSKTPSARKTEYTVKRGDTLISIARRLHSTTDAIARVNKLNSTLIRPGEILAVPHLDFTITIDLPDERVIVHDGHDFITQYPIESVDLPRSRKPVVQTRVAAKSFLKNGEEVTPDAGLASVAMPWIHLKRSGYVLYGVEESNENSDSEIAVEEKSSSADSTPAGRPPKGIAMLKEDIAQLDVLIRKGTPVTIILNRE